MRFRAAIALITLAGCGELKGLLPPAPDGGHTTVPGTYLDARVSPGHRFHLQLSGEKQLSCHDCHYVADAGFHADAVKPCATCHEKQQEHHHPFDGGVQMTCFSCHVFRSVGEAARIDKWGCQRCHVEPGDGGAPLGPPVGAPNPENLPPHITVHTKKCEECHRPHGTPFTLAADCGKCHDVTVSHGKGEKALPADTCMTCHPHHTEAKVASTQCTSCHMSKQVPVTARVQPGALFEGGHVACSSCHKPHQFVVSKALPCISCHKNKPELAADKHGACVKCHAPHSDHAAPKTCQSCHAKLDVKHPPDVEGHTCTGCHPPHSAEIVAPAKAVGCISCHKAEKFTGIVHSEKTGCANCHVAHQDKPKREGLCVKCHEKQLTLTLKNPGHKDCAKCHAGLPHGPPVGPKPCLDCHTGKQPPQKGHVECASCHQSHSAKVVKACTDCHSSPLPGLHTVAKHAACATCHKPHAPPPGLEPKTCLKCHQPPARSHPGQPQQCVGCHLFRAQP
ncbi:MAG: cytochrome c3 family protein [Myxococcaceae bacterium]